MKKIALIGAAAVGDYIYRVDHLPEKGEIVTITGGINTFIPGGCAPNIACGVANFGRAIPVLRYPVGNDFEKLGLQEEWERRNIYCKLAYVDDINSGCAWMYMQEDGTTMCFAFPGAADHAIPDSEELDEEMVVIAPKLNSYTETYLKKSIEQRRTVVVTGIGDKRLLSYLGDIDILIINKCELGQLCRAGEFADMNDITLRYPKLKMYVTFGAEGSFFCTNGTRIQIPIVKAAVIRDFTGAGDAYTSGIVSAVADGYGYVQAGYIGACASSFALEYMGGQTYRSSWQDIMNRLKKQHPEWKDA